MDGGKPDANPIISLDNYHNSLDSMMHDFPYKRAIGTLLNLSNNTRPDICFAVNYVARFQSDPKNVHWKLVKRILRYLKGTIDVCLKFNKTSDELFEVYVDADYGGDPTSRRSTSGYLIKYRGNAIHWRSQLQQTIARSTTEAEYVAICEMSNDILFIDKSIIGGND